MSDNYQATFAAPLTRAELVADNPYIPQFEFLQESDASLGVKVGPGYWNDLPYINQTGIKVYRALLTQSSTDAPVATVFENTLGGVPVWTRNSAGDYSCTLAGAFPDLKTMVTQNNVAASGVIYSVSRATDDVISVLTTVLSIDFPGEVVNYIGQDNALGNDAAIEILVYP